MANLKHSSDLCQLILIEDLVSEINLYVEVATLAIATMMTLSAKSYFQTKVTNMMKESHYLCSNANESMICCFQSNVKKISNTTNLKNISLNFLSVLYLSENFIDV